METIAFVLSVWVIGFLGLLLLGVFAAALLPAGTLTARQVAVCVPAALLCPFLVGLLYAWAFGL